MNFFNFKKNYYKYFLFLIFNFKNFGSEENVNACCFCKTFFNEFISFEENSKSIFFILQKNEIKNFDYFSKKFTQNLISFFINSNFNLCKNSEKKNSYYFSFLNENENNVLNNFKNLNNFFFDFINSTNEEEETILKNNFNEEFIKNYIIFCSMFSNKLRDDDIKFCYNFNEKIKELKILFKEAKNNFTFVDYKDLILEKEKNLFNEIAKTIHVKIKYSSESNSKIMIAKLQNEKPFLEKYFYKNLQTKKINFENKYQDWNYKELKYDLKKTEIQIKMDESKKIIFPKDYSGLIIPKNIYFDTNKIMQIFYEKTKNLSKKNKKIKNLLK